MMPMKKKEINIRIANMLPFSVSVSEQAEEEIWLEAADRVNYLWSSWSKRFPDKSSEEVLGMVTLRFAQAFVIHNRAEKSLQESLAEFEKDVDKILRDGNAALK